MNIHWLQHVPFEGLGSLQSWAQIYNHKLLGTRFWAGDALPDPREVKLLIVMGGPMGVDDERRFPWLSDEKAFISAVIENHGAVLGICLGAQLLARVLGARVYTNEVKEIGWFPIRRASGVNPPFQQLVPEEVTVFHWHGDTFDLPPDANLLATSEACQNQAFVSGDRLMGLQYHLEMTVDGIENIVLNCGDELTAEEWIQQEAEIRGGVNYMSSCKEIMERVLRYLVALG